MKTGLAVALALLAFAAGALVTTAAASGTLPDMSGWTAGQMVDFCRGMMGG